MGSEGTPESFSHADFTAAVAAETGVPAAELTRRADPVVDPDDNLLALAKAANAGRKAERGGDLPDILRPLADQYEDQVQKLLAIGCELRDGSLSFTGIDGQVYTLPDQEGIEKLLAEKADLLIEKSEQGFDRLLLVPFGMSIDHLAEQYEAALREAHANGRLCDVDGSQLDLNTEQPVYDWVEMRQADLNNEIVYDPKRFDDNHGGKTKAEMLADGATPGWQILLVEDVERQGLGNNPRENAAQTVGDRPQLVTNHSSNDYLSKFGEEPYQGEVGLTPEAYIALVLNELKEHGKVLDTETGTFLTGAWMPGQREVPYATWSRGRQRAHLSADLPGDVAPAWGVRAAVRVT